MDDCFWREKKTSTTSVAAVLLSSGPQDAKSSCCVEIVYDEHFPEIPFHLEEQKINHEVICFVFLHRVLHFQIRIAGSETRYTDLDCGKVLLLDLFFLSFFCTLSLTLSIH